MKRWYIAAALTLALGSLTLLPASAFADPPRWAPAHGWRAKHRYVYYPDAEVYYAPDTHMWFWLGGKGWQAGVSLPGDLHAYVHTGGVDIELGVDRPYLRHTYVVDHYGGHPHRHYEHRRYRHGHGHDDDDYDRDHHGHGHWHEHGHGHDHGRGHGHGHDDDGWR